MMHRATAASHRAPRKGRRRATIITLTLAILSVAAVAFAAVLATAPIGGSVGAAKFTIAWSTTPKVVDYGHNASCSAAQGNITVSRALVGGYCDFAGTLQNTGDAGLNPKIVGVELNLPEGWEVELLSGCGEAVRTPSNTTGVKFRVTRVSEAGGAANIPEGSGVQAVPGDDYRSAMCA